jgi:hypothetical protein
MKRKLLYTLMFSSVLGLQACGGGGGGGPSYVLPSTPSPGIPGSAPSPSTPAVSPATLVATINPLVAASVFGSAVNMFVSDLTSTGSQNVIELGGFTGPGSQYVNSKIGVFGWQNGQMVDQTSQWFTGDDNIVIGSPKVTFGNFTGSGRQSMFIAPGTDGRVTGTEAQLFVNNGTNFTRYNITLPHSLDSNDSVAFNYGGIDNVVALGYPYSEVIMGSPTNNFRAYAVSNVSGASIASGNFLGTGAPSFVVGQYGSSSTLGATPDALVGFNFDGTTVTMPFIRNMPVPLFNSTQSYLDQTGGSNTVKVVKMDFDESGVDSVFILAMPNNWQISPWQSSIQFLKNNGSGIFTDVTATTVTGYDMTKPASPSPVIVDLLNTGLPDIVLPYSGGAQVLMQVSKGQYVGSMSTTITDFQNQVQKLLTGGQTSANSTVTFVQGPNNNLYLLGNVPETINGTSANQFYLSSLTNKSVALSAQQAITAARSAWPWLTDAQLNTMVVATGSSYAGVPIIDDTTLFSPTGSLTLANRPISGYVAGLQFNGADSQLTAQDQLGRSFAVNLSPMHVNTWSNAFNMDSEHIDQHELTSHSEYLINGPVNNFGPMRVGSESRNQFNTVGSDPNLGPTLGALPRNYTIGVPRAWQNGSWSAGTQYTTLSYNPWLSFGGSWGMVRQSNNLDTTVRYNEGGFTAVTGVTYTTTQLTPGLITKVNDIYGVWGEAGYRWQNNFGVYAGVKPVAISGNVQANLPTGIDNHGNIMYTGRSLALQNQTTGYVRALWATDIDKKTSYRVSGTAMSNGQYRLMHELRFFFD